MKYSDEIQKGWDFSSEVLEANIAVTLGDDYISKVEAAIEDLEYNINNHQYRNLDVQRLQGYMLEEWASGTFNVDAVAAGSKDRANVMHSLEKDSVDIQLDSGKQISAKSYATGEQSAKAQARLNVDTREPSYKGQDRLVPTDKLEDAKAEAHRQALRNKLTRPDVSRSYEETEHKLTDTVKNNDGISSKGVNRKELDKIATESKEQKFKASNHGIDANNAVNMDYIMKQALKAGYTTAAVSVAFQLTPEIYKAIDYLIKNGEIDIKVIAEIGEKGISAGAEGFLRGAISSSLLIMCEKGALGDALKTIDPTVLGTVVALVMQTVKNSILVAAGRMTPQQMGSAFVDSVVISGGYLLGAKIGGIIGQLIGAELPVVGYMLGSLIGTSLCVVYNIGKKKLISFCVDTGFTCFGLVEQDYELPNEVLNEIGVDTIDIPRTNVETTNIERTPIQVATIDHAEYETVNLTVLRRGIIGVNKVGYVVS